MRSKLPVATQSEPSAVYHFRTAIGPDCVKTCVATTADKAIRQGCAAHPQVIFTGLSLPDCSGYELVREFCANAETGKSFIVALEAEAPLHRYGDYKAAGFDHVLTKPVKIDEIVQTLTFLSKHRQVLDHLVGPSGPSRDTRTNEQ